MEQQRTTLERLAEELYSSAKTISIYCDLAKHPQRSFEHIEPNTLLPADAPERILRAQQSVNEAATKIQQLVVEPSEFLTGFQTQV